jgi:predicted cupin superfamily sugar epimerase
MDAKQVIEALQLKKHPKEDGYFRETYRSDETFNRALPSRYSSMRSFSTAIYFLIESGKFSSFHRLQSEEVFHFYAGGPAELVVLESTGALKIHTIGPDLLAGHELQVVVHRNEWQALRLVTDASWVLVGCTVAPGFDYLDFEEATRSSLLLEFPQHAEIITTLTLP